MRTRLPLLLLAVSPAFATSSIVLSPGFTGSASAPNAAPYASVQGWRVEMRLWNWSQTASYQGIAQHANFAIRQVGGANTISFQSNADKGGTACFVDMTGRTDAIIRAQRDYANARMTCEVWNIDGSGYTLTTAPFPTPSPTNISGNYSWGDTRTHVNVSYLRMFNTVVAVSSMPPNPNIPGGNLVDYEFERNSNDSSGHAVNIGFGGSPVYATDLMHGPAVILATPPLVVRAATSLALDASQSYALNGNPALTYLWRQTQFVPMLNTASGAAALPQVSAFLDQSQTASMATASPPLAGTYYFQVQVCDTLHQCSQLSLKIGVVPTDSNGIVIIPDSRMSLLLGPMTMWGTSPWPWYDFVMKADGDTFGTNMPSGPPFAPTTSGSPGTIAVTKGGGTVTGTGTAFQTDFACNGTDGLVIYYTLANGKTGARPYFVTACSSQTSMTIVQGRDGPGSGGYDASASQSGLHYDKYAVANEGAWINGSNNWNYYDVVLALYRLYYRTGIDTYLTYARQLAANWWIFPMDGGRAYNNAGLYPPQGSRTMGLLGLMAAALDNQPGWWLDSAATGAPSAVSGIKGMVDYAYSANLQAYFSPPYDPLVVPEGGREPGYTAKFVTAYYYVHDPTYYAEVKDIFLGTNSYGSFRTRNLPGFGFVTPSDPRDGVAGGLTQYGYSTTHGVYRGSVWLTVFMEKALIAFIQASPVPADQAAAMTVLQSSYDSWFAAHYMNGNPTGPAGACQSITYSSNYNTVDSGNMPVNCSAGCPTGTVSATNGSAQVTGSGSNLTNTSIFKNDGTDYIGIFNGVNGNYQIINIPAGNILSATALAMAANFTGTTGSGLSYGRAAIAPNGKGLPNLPQNPYSYLGASMSSCESPAVYGMGGRAIAEVVHEINGFLYVNAPSGKAAYKRQGDALFAGAYGCGTAATGCLSSGLAKNITGGGPGADTGAGNFADILAFPVNGAGGLGKEFGSNAGAGLADTYLAYRLGGLAPAISGTVSVNVDLASVPNAAKARITVWSPAGVGTTTTCTASPCAVTVDVRQGRHTYQVDYLSSGNAVLAPGTPALLPPQ